MESYEKYFIYQPDFKKLFENGALIVPDTNFLLAAYQSRNITIDEVKKVLKELSKKGKLVIPEQVMFEFSKNRQKIILEQIASIDIEINRIKNPQKEMKSFMPASETSAEIIDAQKKRDALYDSIQGYQKSLRKVKEKILALITHDEYYDFIKELCKISFRPYSKSKDILRDEGLKRISLGIKPGTNEKKSDPTGDYIIWSEIMDLKQNVIFVSNDQKEDWIYKNNDRPLGVDQTLLSEFYSKTGGKYFTHVSPREFIKFLVPELEKEVEEDLDKANKITTLDFSILNTIPEMKDCWEIHLNRIPTIDDVKTVEKIIISLGFTDRPLVFLTYEDEKAFSIIASSLGMEKYLIDQITEKIQENFIEELCRLSYPGSAFYVYE